MVISDNYSFSCDEDGTPTEKIYYGMLVNVGPGYAHNVSFSIGFNKEVCMHYFDSIKPGETVPLLCKIPVNSCSETLTMVIELNKVPCEYLTYPEHLDRIAAKDQEDDQESETEDEQVPEEEEVLEQVFDPFPTWDCQPGPSMINFL